MPIDKAKVDAAEESGYNLSGDIGGIPKTTYYTPDGRIIKAIAAIRDYVKKDRNGRVIEQGKRDANLDKGWLTSMPTQFKLYCSGCDRWHDTKEQVGDCIKKQKRWVDGLARKTMGEMKEAVADDPISLKQEVAELKALVNQLMKAKA